MQISVWVDNIEDIEEDPDTAQILCTYEGTSLSAIASQWLSTIES